MFRHGMKSGVAIAIGYAPVALTFGLLAKSTGLSIVETTLMSMIVFAGAAQYISLNLLSLGTGSFEIILTTFILNIRHFLMSASLNEKAEHDPLWKKALYAFGITDETFSVAAMKEGTVSASYMFGLIFISYSSWVINSAIGHIVGAYLPESVQVSLSVALYAMFVGLLIPAIKTERKALWLAVCAGAINCMLLLWLHVPKGWAIVIATIVSAIFIQWIGERRKEQTTYVQ
ncbi:AzlC family ABC transporter permease [Anoxybacillus sp. LAT_35]|uniref:AzlC family ABC transporter permease n=1 Tax=Anoxybacillus TaxID=150247 RepID=UPI001EDA9DAB|nr:MULTISPECIES: AzlC family ABC transporter permease [Anoxybacillus]MCG5025452.1 AzlC family ABC transporter permease [Anoxybacillus flavithermus]MCG6196404.1 AzlC family ABC transporter permease [Anoxybacillus sp. LAT_38]MCG3083884.1 AzlC family ABC transporter permease [Anoxybacillus sp. LAT27]MCG3085405.1 AzlC family ABC transporter permease [Anoxybacillus sp. LAT27]MCG6170546.1 AzlC family ABC transporter permease [Anoxybacillus sp. LAT_11]